MRILVLGASGMLGNAMLRVLDEYEYLEVYGTVRSSDVQRFFPVKNSARLMSGVDVENQDALMNAFCQVRPQVVINCVGLIKQLAEAGDPLRSIPINALLPHRLARLCAVSGARLVHISTDCVFSGNEGNYKESDTSDPDDLYGRTKLLGEVNEKHCLTLRTSMIGLELSRKKNLLEWFLAQNETIKGYKKVIFSGFTTLELSRIIENMIINYPEANGVYHVSSEPISKYDLLSLIKKGLKLPTEIIPDESFSCDRSLDSGKFRQEFNYQPPSWEEMIDELCKDIGDHL